MLTIRFQTLRCEPPTLDADLAVVSLRADRWLRTQWQILSWQYGLRRNVHCVRSTSCCTHRIQDDIEQLRESRYFFAESLYAFMLALFAHALAAQARGRVLSVPHVYMQRDAYRVTYWLWADVGEPLSLYEIGSPTVVELSS